MHWPFQSIATDTVSIFTAPAPELFRRGTWQPPKTYDSDKDSAASTRRGSTLIPDYVVNFIRGETPESVARRKQNGGNRGMRAVDITHQHRPQRSHMALMMLADDVEAGDGGGRRRGDGDDAQSHVTSTSTTTELQQILRDGQRSRGGWRRVTTGWRSGVLLSLVLVLVMLIAGFVCLVIAGTKITSLAGPMDLFTGSCSAAATLNWGLHALINVAVVVVIVGANYAFQVLSSPTRTEVSEVHENRKWLEIGVPSVRNFWYVGRGRAFLAMVLLAVAVMTQIIYNSLIFTTTAGTTYDLIAVEPSFLTGAQFSNSSSSNAAALSRAQLLDLQSLLASGGGALTNLTTTACVDLFDDTFNAEYSNIILSTSDDNSLVATAQAGFGANNTTTSASTLITTTATTSGVEILVDGSSVSYCLAERTASPTCTVNLNPAVFATILGLNLVTLLLMGATLLVHQHSDPLVTLGDAIASFLREPDPSTRDNALVTRENLRLGLGGWGFTEGKYWSPTRTPLWLSAPSLAQWATAGSWWLVATALAAAALILTVVTDKTGNVHGLSPFGIATPRTTYLFTESSSTTTIIPAAALAIAVSTPQVLLAGLYFSTNALLTAFFLSRESSLYTQRPGRNGAAPRSLRVSADPVGVQATSLYLTLPRPVSWALAVWFAAMGFVLSQSCFVVSVEESDASSSNHLRGLGLSGTALLVLLAMLIILLLAVAAAGLQRLPPSQMADGRATGNPLAIEGGSCSAVLSARCHRMPEEAGVWMKKVLWGVVTSAGGQDAGSHVGHVTYSARGVGELDGNRRYI
ncbi:hypothetical protein M406DRAFT_342907 [Cryphonectria parasitica EP155]|uniref:DUF6536 domain-containing protein n=1 Tax=Cryphonectria parasitica (strain ATCC 38755 / EP155) TaxID=660469 RepID=A0A9P4XTX4_CRYP1|nr:uncharacterized protein M406DRAFT_342907 [Cryphonectria parasitica EP155]KAF3760705.1 hypothetical protein M406DRAFT_342907 [Cryphonectria parasitica EP155]